MLAARQSMPISLLLLAYLSLLVSGEDRPSRWAAVGRALALTAAMTPGFVARFRDPRAGDHADRCVGPALPPVGDCRAGLRTPVAGCARCSAVGRSLPVFGWSPRGPKISHNLVGMVGLGGAYVVAVLDLHVSAPSSPSCYASFRSVIRRGGVSALHSCTRSGMGLLVGGGRCGNCLGEVLADRALRRSGRSRAYPAGLPDDQSRCQVPVPA